MGEGFDMFMFMKSFLLCVSPVILVMGFLVLLYGDYRRIEELLAKEVGGISKKITPKLETNRYAFHEWLCERRILCGAAFILCAIFFFLIAKR